jgi:meiosis induction protein kinase IME2/SME1
MPSRPAEEKTKKIGRQLSVNSHSNHYAEVHRLEAERALNANAANNGSGLMSPPYQKESFFSHLRKRARRFSGRHGLASPSGDDVEANAAAVPWSNRSSMIVDNLIPEAHNDFTDLDKALANVRYSLERTISTPDTLQITPSATTTSPLKRTHSTQNGQSTRSLENLQTKAVAVSARTRRALQMTTHPVHHYETPEEADELLDEALTSINQVSQRLDKGHRNDFQKHRTILTQKDYNKLSVPHVSNNSALGNNYSYPTPSPSAKREGVNFGNMITPAQPLNITKHRSENDHVPSYWPTPPSEENEWVSAAAISNFVTTSNYR